MKYLRITKTRSSLLDTMKKYSSKSILRNKHCACLVTKNNKIVCIEVNQYLPANYVKCSTHAEVSLHKSLNKKYIKNFNRNKYDLWVIRYSKKNGFVDSKPCSKCIKYMKKRMYYIDKIVYSNDMGGLTCEDIEDIESEHISIGYKKNYIK